MELEFETSPTMPNLIKEEEKKKTQLPRTY